MPSASELTRLSATEAVALLRKGDVTPLDLIEAAAARIESVETQVNALPVRFLDVAREKARRLERRKDPPRGWLAGLPVAAKEYNDVAGQRTTYGSPIFADNVTPEHDI